MRALAVGTRNITPCHEESDFDLVAICSGICGNSLLDDRRHIRSTAYAIAAAAGCSPRLVVTVRAGRTRIVAAIVVWVRLLTLAAIVTVHHNLLCSCIRLLHFLSLLTADHLSRSHLLRLRGA